MSFSIGRKVKYTIFGASHDICVGGMIDGIQAGIKIDFDFINKELNRRRPKRADETARVESDDFLFISGLENGHTTEAPFAFALKNADIKKADYNKFQEIFRPGHADFSKFKKYNGHAFKTGGGVFSGRMTASIVVMGAVIKKLLADYGVGINSEVMFAKKGTGSRIKVQVTGLKVGVGEPFFDSLEANISKAMFGIPSIKGINFGEIENLYDKNISEYFEEYELRDGLPKLTHNYWGGIDGGISNGEEIYFYVLLKPIQTHDFEVNTLSKNGDIVRSRFNGRHDKNIADRVGVVIEAMTAMIIYDELMVSEL